MSANERVSNLIFMLLILSGVLGTAYFFFYTPEQEPLTLVYPTPPPQPTAIPTATSAPIFVFVTGEVQQPGVYALAPDSRIVHALQAAGGLTENAAVESLNQAVRIYDEMQIHMPARGEAPPPVITQPTTSNSTSAPAASNSGLVSINHADSETLQTLPGIGPVLANRIIQHREGLGPFSSIEELKDVQGIGASMFGKLQHLLTVD